MRLGSPVRLPVMVALFTASCLDDYPLPATRGDATAEGSVATAVPDVGADEPAAMDAEMDARASHDARVEVDGGIDVAFVDVQAINADRVGVDASDAGVDAAIAPDRTCPSDATRCEGVCVDVMADSAHCGTCDVHCDDALTCVSGVCALICAPGLTVCGMTCRDLARDDGACGECGRACGTGLRCIDGACRCPPNASTSCDGTCVDVQSDPAHCGACGLACPSGMLCSEGTCATSCGGTSTICSGRCRQLSTDPTHCGACESTCAPQQTCAAGSCVGRHLAPLSTSTVTSHTPTLHWLGGRAHIEICRDPLCARVEQAFDAERSSAAPPVPLAAGLHFWHVRLAAATTYSPTWAFRVRVRSTAVDTSWGTELDVNRDGFADVIVGDPGSSVAYIYMGSSSGVATTPAATLIGPGGSSFGWDVSSAGDVNGDGYADVVVGANQAAYVFLGGSTGLATTALAVLPGSSVSNQRTAASDAGDVNHDGYADVVVATRGQVSVHLGGPSGTFPVAAFALAVAPGAAFAASAGDVNGDGNADLLVADPDGPQIYLGTATGLAATPSSALLTPWRDPRWPIASTSAGDVNADGYADVVTGGGYCDSTLPEACEAHVYLGGPAGIVETSSAHYALEATAFGSSIAQIGDFNGDGYGDLVGAGWFRCEAVVRLGDVTGVGSATERMRLEYSSDGCSFSGAGDLNRDGYADVIVGGIPGTAHEVLGGTAGATPRLAVTLPAPVRANPFSHSAAGIGDINGDGRADVAVGDKANDRVFVYAGSTTGLGGRATAMLRGSRDSGFGASVAAAGDVNRDGYGDLVVAAYSPDTAYLFLGGPAGLEATPSATLPGTGAVHYVRVAGAGDVNHDGYADVVVAREGVSLALHLGSATGLSTTPTQTLREPGGGAYASSVAGVGDLNGDGYADVAVANGYEGMGSVIVYAGGPTGFNTSPMAVLTRRDFGYAAPIAGAVDLNHDGFSDLAIGGTREVFVYLGSRSGLSRESVAGSPWGSAAFLFVDRAGDVNRDGFGDLVVGVNSNDDLYVFLGGAGGFAPSSFSVRRMRVFTSGVAAAGDVDGDGYDDVLVVHQGGDDLEGPAELFRGGASGTATVPAPPLFDPPFARFGAAVALSFDFAGWPAT